MEFKEAVKIVLKFEGGLIDHPKDPGGITKYGISKRAYPDLDIKKLTKKQAIDIYKRDYWDKCSCDSLPHILRLAVFDCSVNQGKTRALKYLDKTVLEKNKSEVLMFLSYMKKRREHYMRLKSFPVFGRGWMRRLFHVYDESLKELS